MDKAVEYRDVTNWGVYGNEVWRIYGALADTAVRQWDHVVAGVLVEDARLVIVSGAHAVGAASDDYTALEIDDEAAAILAGVSTLWFEDLATEGLSPWRFLFFEIRRGTSTGGAIDDVILLPHWFKGPGSDGAPASELDKLLADLGPFPQALQRIHEILAELPTPEVDVPAANGAALIGSDTGQDINELWSSVVYDRVNLALEAHDWAVARLVLNFDDLTLPPQFTLVADLDPDGAEFTPIALTEAEVADVQLLAEEWRNELARADHPLISEAKLEIRRLAGDTD